MTLHPYPTATCPECGHTRRIVQARSCGTYTRYMFERRRRRLDLPPGARQVRVWFSCGHKELIVTSQLEELGISLDGQGCARSQGNRR
jgi:hypothetical protein